MRSITTAWARSSTLAAWAHSKWVRIHPFANGNGRTARTWANLLLLRYGLRPVVRLRPRPGGNYGAAGAAAMWGHWAPMTEFIRKLIDSAMSAARSEASAKKSKPP